jgi:hypothetical protein
MSDDPTTRPSLLLRMRDARDHEAWHTFVELYAPLVYRFARKRGLQDADAADLTQDVLRSVAYAMKGDKYDPARGSFRGWLHTVTRNAVYKSLRGGQRQPSGTGGKPLSGPQARDLRWFPDRWMHIALVWYKADRGFNWRVFIDGRHGDPRRLTGGPGVFEQPKGFQQLLIGAGGDPRRPGALDVVIDDLRLSSVARYKLDRGSHAIAVPTDFAVDKHTLGLFRFEGDVTGEGFGGKTYKADFTNRDN